MWFVLDVGFLFWFVFFVVWVRDAFASHIYLVLATLIVPCLPYALWFGLFVRFVFNSVAL